MIADLHVLKRNFLFGAIIAHDAGGFGRQVEQGANGAAGALARAKLNHLAQQHQHHNHGGSLEIDRNRPIGLAKGVGENSREHRCHHRIGESRAHPQRDKREHVEVHGHNRLPATLEERQAAPHDHRGCQDKFNPHRGGARNIVFDRQADIRAHGQDQHRDR